MSALFGKKDYKAVFKKLVSKDDFDAVLSYAIKTGDALYDKGETSRALEVYLDLLEVCKGKKVTYDLFYEKIYEKITPLLFELEENEKGIHYAILLTEEKLKHNEEKEAVEIISALKGNFPENMDVAKEAIKVYTHIGELEKAFDIVDKLIKTKGSKIELIEIAGELLFNLKRYDDAESYFRVIERMDPDNEIAKKRLSEIEKLKEESEVSNPEETVQAVENKVELKEKVSVEEAKRTEIPQQEKMEASEKKAYMGELKEKSKEEVPTAEVKRIEIPQYKKVTMPKEPVEEEVIEAKKSPETSHKEVEISKKEEYTFVNDPEYIKALEYANSGSEEEAKKLLFSVAEKYKKINPIEAEYIYNKILFMEPDNIEAIREISHLKENKEEAIFYLKTALKYVKGEERIDILKELTNLLPDDVELKKILFNDFIKLGKKEEAVSMFFEIMKAEPNASSIALSLLPLIKEDVKYLTKVSTFFRYEGISNNVAFQYFYATGKILFNMGEKDAGIEWLMMAHKIDKLSLDDYIEIGNYIAHIPNAKEKEAIAKSLYGYVDNIRDSFKAKQVIQLLMELSPNNEQYIVKELDLLKKEGNVKELAKELLKFVEKNPAQYAGTIYELTEKVMDQLGTEDLLKIAHFLKEANNSQLAIKIYKEILEREPDNKEALLNTFVAQLENGQANDIVSFFDKFAPSHIFAPALEDKIREYRERRSENPLDYNTHYIIGFLYFVEERYEEAIASFQFVVRSKHYIPLMSLFIGMSFDKIGLPDFAAKHYEIGLSSKDIPKEVKVRLLYRLALYKKEKGQIAECRDLLEKALQIDPQFKPAQDILLSIPGEGKVIPIKGEKE